MVVMAAAIIRGRRRNRQLEELMAVADGKLMQLQRQFERFVPSDVVERLTDPSRGIEPARRNVTIMFADLRGFTAMCDRLDPGITVTILNDYFARMIPVITRHHGQVTDLAGDGLLALFGALENNPWQALDAVQAAQAMRFELADYNSELRERGLPELKFGIGIHGGEVVAGVIGTGSLSKFSVTGDPINVASRIEGLTSHFKVDLLISEEIRRALDDRFQLRAMPLATVKGKAVPLQTYFVAPDCAPPDAGGSTENPKALGSSQDEPSTA
jgi:adenylate cyclase